jgi:monofunctional glycosyltransferase
LANGRKFLERMPVSLASAPSSIRRRHHRLRYLSIWAAALLVGLPATLTLLYAVVPPPITPLMIVRLVQGEGLAKTWRSRDHIAPDLFRAVIAGEDARFCTHFGFDSVELENAWRGWRDGGRVRGASTITMQTARNLFLWQGRSLVRKAAEAYLTPFLELAWSKARILEIYVNIVEWGPGIYGAEAAAQTYFGKPASALDADEAALLAAVLPNPRRWSPAEPTAYIRERAQVIRARMAEADIAKGAICP